MERGAGEPGVCKAAGGRRRLWSRVVEVVAVSMLGCWGATSLAPGAGWVVDLCANLSAQGLAVGVLMAAWFGIRRRWWSAMACGLVVVAFGWALLQPRALHRSVGAPGGLRLVVVNGLASNPEIERSRDWLEGSRADVVVLLEPPWELRGEIRREGALSEYYPWRVAKGAEANGSHEVVLSRLPMREVEVTGRAAICEAYTAVVVTTPAGDVGLVSMQPESPRTLARWRRGNEAVRQAAGMARAMREELGIPVILAADLNSTPTGWRSRYLWRESGLRRGKPLWRATGTYPAWGVWPMILAIDDVWISPGLETCEWVVIDGLPGSDHRAVECYISRSSDS